MSVTVVPRNTYDKIEAANISMLLEGVDNMEKLKYAKTHPKEKTPEKTFGIAYHLSVFEPGDFGKRVIQCPYSDYKKQEARDWRDEQELNGLIPLKADAMQQIREMKEALLKHPDVAEILSTPGKSEVALEWIDPDTQVKCKGRLDRLSQYKGYTWIWDLKTCQSAALREFQRSVINDNYHCRADWYLSGCNALHEADRRFCWIAQEKTPPYSVALYEPDDNFLSAGKRIWKRLLKEYKEACETKIFKGYPLGIETLEMPAWGNK